MFMFKIPGMNSKKKIANLPFVLCFFNLKYNTYEFFKERQFS